MRGGPARRGAGAERWRWTPESGGAGVDAVVGGDPRDEVRVRAHGVGLGVDDEPAAVGLDAEQIDHAGQQRAAAGLELEGELVLAPDGPGRAQPRGDLAGREGARQAARALDVAAARLQAQARGELAHRRGLGRGGAPEVELLDERVDEDAAL